MDDFDTQVTAEEYYDRDDMSCEYDTDAPIDTDRVAQAEEYYRGEGYDTDTIAEFVKRDEEFYGGWTEDEADYHDTWRDEQAQDDVNPSEE